MSVKKMRKKFIAMFLVLIMLLSSVPAMAFGNDVENFVVQFFGNEHISVLAFTPSTQHATIGDNLKLIDLGVSIIGEPNEVLLLRYEISHDGWFVGGAEFPVSVTSPAAISVVATPTNITATADTETVSYAPHLYPLDEAHQDEHSPSIELSTYNTGADSFDETQLINEPDAVYSTLVNSFDEYNIIHEISFVETTDAGIYEVSIHYIANGVERVFTTAPFILEVDGGLDVFAGLMPLNFASPFAMRYVAAGLQTGMAIRNDGTLWGWGRNSGQMLGIGGGPNVSQNRPVQIGTATNWTSVSVSNGHAVALRSDGSMWSWGNNSRGLLGDGSFFAALAPRQISAVGSTWRQVSAGGEHTLAIRSDGTLWSWGSNESGQLGIGSAGGWNDYRDRPVQVGTASDWIDIATGARHSLGLRSNGTLWAWGENGGGQLGDGTTTNRHLPVQVGSVATWASISACAGMSFGIRSNGSLWGWGFNTNGQLGDGTTTNRNAPVQLNIPHATGWASVSAGNGYAMAMRTDGSIWGWGQNSRGRIGDGTTTNRNRPTQINPATTGWVQVSAGNMTLAIRDDGTIWSWGGNGSGELGNGTTVDANSPTMMPALSTQVVVSPSSTSVPLGTTRQFSATVAGINFPSQGVTWAVTGNNSPSTWINASGLLTVASDETSMNLTVRATSTHTTTVSGTAAATIPISPPSFITSNLPAGTINVGYSATIVSSGDGTITKNVVLGSLPPGLSLNNLTGAISGIPSEGGIFTFTVRAQNIAGPTDRQFTISINVPVTGVSLVDSNGISVDNLALYDSDTFTLFANVHPYNATVRTVAWSSNNQGVVTVQNGLLTAVSPGQATITATTTEGGFSSSAVVNVSPVLVTGINLNMSDITLLIGNHETVSATISPYHATNQNINWHSSHPNIATADNNGIIRAVSAGAATITASIVCGNGVHSATVEVAVILSDTPMVATPVAYPAQGRVLSGTVITLETQTLGATIRYTLDNSVPTIDSPEFAGVTITGLTTIRARAFMVGHTDSNIITLTYDVIPIVDAPVANPIPGIISIDTEIELTSETEGAVIRFTLDNSEPNENSIPFTTPITIKYPTVIRAMAFRSGWLSSEESIFNYDIRLPLPNIIVRPFITSGRVLYGSQVSINSSVPGATIHFTLDGSEPTLASPIYEAGVITITQPITINAMAVMDGWVESEIATIVIEYVSIDERNIRALAPTSNFPIGTMLPAGTNIILSSHTAGATIIYTLDGSIPTESNGYIFSDSIRIAVSPLIIRAVAFMDGLEPSDISTFVYAIGERSTAPVAVTAFGITPQGGTTGLDLNVVNGQHGLNGNQIQLTNPDGGIIRYYIDTLGGTTGGWNLCRVGTIPSGGIIEVNFPQRIRAIAISPGRAISETMYFTYRIDELEKITLDIGRFTHNFVGLLSENIPILGGNTYGWDFHGIPATVFHGDDGLTRIVVGASAGLAGTPWGRGMSHLERQIRFSELRRILRLPDNYIHNVSPRITIDKWRLLRQSAGVNPYLVNTASGLTPYFGRSNEVTRIAGYVEGVMVDGNLRVLNSHLHLHSNERERLWIGPVLSYSLSARDEINYNGRINLENMRNITPGNAMRITYSADNSLQLGIRFIAAVGYYESVEMTGQWTFPRNHYILNGTFEKGTRGTLFFFLSGDLPTTTGHFTVQGDGPSMARGFAENINGTRANFDSGAFNLDNFAFTSRNHLHTQSDWLGGGLVQRQNNNVPSLLQRSVHHQTVPLVSEASGHRVMVFLADNGLRNDLNSATLMYSIYSNATWSEPRAIFDDGTADFYPSIASDGTNIWVSWHNSTTLFAEGTTVDQILANSEIAVARFDSNRGTFVDYTVFTRSGNLETMPVISAYGGEAAVAWIQNTNNDIFATSGFCNSIMVSRFANGSWSQPTVVSTGMGVILDMDIGHFNGNFHIAYLTDRDNNIETLSDRDLIVVNLAGVVANRPATDTFISTPRFVAINGVQTLTWFEYRNIRYISTSGQVSSMFSEPNMLTDNFRLLSNGMGETVVVYSAHYAGEGYFMARLQDSSGYWGNSFVLAQTGDVPRFFDGVLEQNGDIALVFNNARRVVLGEGDTAILVESNNLYSLRTAPQVSIKLENVFYFPNDIRLGEQLPVSIGVRNIGGVLINSIDVDVNGVTIGTFPLDNGLRTGKIATIDFDISIPVNMLAQTDFTITVRPTGQQVVGMSDNTRIITLGHANLLLSLERRYQDDTSVTIYAHVTNESDFATNAMLFVRRESLTGNVVDFAEIGEINGRQEMITTFNFDPAIIIPEGQDFEILLLEVVSSTEGLFANNNHAFVVIDALNSHEAIPFPVVLFIDTQDGTLREGEAGAVSFAVTTQDILPGAEIEIININSVPGISLVPTSTLGDLTIIVINTTDETPEGSHPLLLLIDGLISPTFFLHVGVPATFTTTLINGGAGTSVSPNPAIAGQVVNINVGTAPANYRFGGWTTLSPGVTFVNANSANTQFVMPNIDVIITATFVPVQVNLPDNNNNGNQGQDNNQGGQGNNNQGNQGGNNQGAGNQQTTPRLLTPRNVRIVGETISWSAVNNATSYRLYVGGVPRTEVITDTSFDLMLLELPAGTYAIQVRAVFSGTRFNDSALSSSVNFIVYPTPDPLPTLDPTPIPELMPTPDATPTPDPILVPWINPFTDVNESDWFFNSVRFAHQNNLFSGTSATTFSPNMTMTRGMMVTVLHRMAGSPEPGNAVFTDVEPNRWYTDGVNWAAANGIVVGYGDGRFGPSDDITREQMAVILNNYARFMGIELPSVRTGTFADDAAISSWAREAVNAMFEAEILSGRGGDIFGPRATATRAEVASMLRNFLKTVEASNETTHSMPSQPVLGLREEEEANETPAE